MLHAKSKCADQPAHPRSLICAFVIRYLQIRVVNLATCKKINILASTREQAGLSYLVGNPKDRFSSVKATVDARIGTCL